MSLEAGQSSTIMRVVAVAVLRPIAVLICVFVHVCKIGILRGVSLGLESLRARYLLIFWATVSHGDCRLGCRIFTLY